MPRSTPVAAEMAENTTISTTSTAWVSVPSGMPKI